MKKKLFKARPIIQVSHRFNRIQFLLFNYLIANAFFKLNEKVFRVPMSEIKEFLGDQNNDAFFRLSLLSLKCEVSYNILDDGDIVTLVDDIRIENGICIYSFSDKLVEILKDPKIYATLNLEILKEFTNKYALFLYEFCYDYRGIFNTPFIDLNIFRKLMGLRQGQYPKLSHLIKYVINKAVEEINKISDINLKVVYKRVRGNIEIGFKIGNKASSGVAKELVVNLRECGVKKIAAEEFVKKYDYDLIREKIAYFHLSRRPIIYPDRWFTRVFKYCVPILDEEQNNMARRLRNCHVSKKAAERLAYCYSKEEILDKVDMYHESKVPIQKPDRWFSKALSQKWIKRLRIDETKDEELVRCLVDYKVNEHVARGLVQFHTSERIKRVIEVAESRKMSLRSIPGFIVSSLKDGRDFDRRIKHMPTGELVAAYRLYNVLVSTSTISSPPN